MYYSFLTNYWGVARSLIAISTLTTYLFNGTENIYFLQDGLDSRGYCNGWSSVLLPCIVSGGEYTISTHFLMVGMLALVATGALPAITGILHFYACLNNQYLLSTIDGGDQISLVFSIIALPICLLDWRLTHWHRQKIDPVGNKFRLAVIYIYIYSLESYYFKYPTFILKPLRRNLKWSHGLMELHFITGILMGS